MKVRFDGGIEQSTEIFLKIGSLTISESGCCLGQIINDLRRNG